MKMKTVGRWILGIIIAFVILYLIAWFGGRYWLGSHYKQLLETAEQNGLTIQTQDVEWGGFPFGYRLTWIQPTVTFNQSQTPLQIKAEGQHLSAEWFLWYGLYFTWHGDGPTKVEAQLPQEPKATFLNEGGWHGFVSFNKPKPSFGVTFDKLTIEGIKSQKLNFDQLSLSWLAERPPLDVNPDDLNYEAKLNVQGWQIPTIVESIDPIATELVKALGRQVQEFNLHLTFPAAWIEDGHFVKSWEKDESPLTIDRLAITWGEFKAHANGEVFLDSKGQFMPDVTIETENSGQIIRIIAAQPFIDRQTAMLLRLAAPVLLHRVRLMSSDGELYLGPVPLGPLPRLPANISEEISD